MRQYTVALKCTVGRNVDLVYFDLDRSVARVHWPRSGNIAIPHLLVRFPGPLYTARHGRIVITLWVINCLGLITAALAFDIH